MVADAEKHTSPVALQPKSGKVDALWRESHIFDTAGSEETKAVFKVWLGSNKVTGILVAQTMIDVGCSVPTTNEIEAKFPGQPAASLIVTVQSLFQRSQREGMSGRPMSAKSRIMPITPINLGGRPISTRPSLRSTDERSTSGDVLDSSTVTNIDRMLQRLLNDALDPITQRITELEKRIRRNESMISVHLQRGLAVSRPSSAESSHSHPDALDGHRNPVTDDQLTAKFRTYDTFGTGAITKQQLIHFYRTHNSFALDESEDWIVKEIGKLVRVEDDSLISFHDFCVVALRLAKA